MVGEPLQFEIWVELEHVVDPPEGVEEEFCNATIIFANGSSVGVNIWSKALYDSCDDHLFWINGDVAIFPDLVLREFSSKAIRSALTMLVNEDNWLVGRGLPSEEDDDWV